MKRSIYRFVILLCGMMSVVMSVRGAQEGIRGVVKGRADQKAIAGATVTLRSGRTVTVTDAKGEFVLPLYRSVDTLEISSVGFKTSWFPLAKDSIGNGALMLLLDTDEVFIQEVSVNTGYYRLPKDRLTGSFVHIGQEQLEREVGSNLLTRLEGSVPGLQFVNSGGTTAADIRIRGLATIESGEAPLVVVDDFPYEGDINHINPSDIESVTVLKDAAASSIWGARAGNGVIVITTKQGHYGRRHQVMFNTSFTQIDRPDLFYDPHWLPSSTVMEIERELFERKIYQEANNVPIPAYVEALIKKRDGLLSATAFEALEQLYQATDVREEASRYLYRKGVTQQHNLSVNGGSPAYRYYLSIGRDHATSQVVGNTDERLNVNFRNSFAVLPGLELTLNLGYSDLSQKNNGLSLSQVMSTGRTGISNLYTPLRDHEGQSLAVVSTYRQAYMESAAGGGLLDWSYRPLDEISLRDNRSKKNEMRFMGTALYKHPDWFQLSANYQFQRGLSEKYQFYDQESFMVRNLINRFTQADGMRVLPFGHILDVDGLEQRHAHYGRMQLDIDHVFVDTHHLYFLAGTEWRQDQTVIMGAGQRLFDYDPDTRNGNWRYDYLTRYPVRPSGTSTIPGNSKFPGKFTDRYVSYFANTSYSFDDQYFLTGSARWDASNLFGVRTNQKGVPLWSVGGAWRLDAFKLRLTYGSSGNINKTVTTFPVVQFSGTDGISGLRNAALVSVGNPDLRWERVNTLNAGFDFRLWQDRLGGSLEYYHKSARDLIGLDYMDPTSGIILGVVPLVQNKINYANLSSQGVDIQLNAVLLAKPLRLSTDFVWSYVENKITHFNTGEVNTLSYYTGSAEPPPVVGRSRDVVYALPWHGLDPQTGIPLMYIEEEKTANYAAYFNQLTEDDLIVSGVRVPPFYGSIRPKIEWKGFSLSTMLTWKAGYVFRRSSIFSGSEYSIGGIYHQDYFKRWRQPGDEQFTDVPVATASAASMSGTVYLESAALITRGDHIRWRDLQLQYRIDKHRIGRLPVEYIRLYGYAQNMGLIWRANRYGIDPDYPTGGIPASFSMSFGMQIGF